MIAQAACSFPPSSLLPPQLIAPPIGRQNTHMVILNTNRTEQEGYFVLYNLFYFSKYYTREISKLTPFRREEGGGRREGA